MSLRKQIWHRQPWFEPIVQPAARPRGLWRGISGPRYSAPGCEANLTQCFETVKAPVAVGPSAAEFTQNYGEGRADPQVHASGAICEVPDGEATTLLPSTPVDFAGTPWQPRSMAPAHGEHTTQVLRERGRSDEQIAELQSKGAVGGQDA